MALWITVAVDIFIFSNVWFALQVWVGFMVVCLGFPHTHGFHSWAITNRSSSTHPNLRTASGPNRTQRFPTLTPKTSGNVHETA